MATDSKVQIKGYENGYHFPSVVVKWLSDAKYDINKLPEIDTKDHDGHDYIKYFSPDEMKEPIMKFTDSWGRYGLLFRFKCINKESKEFENKTVIHFYQRAPGLDSIWVFTIGNKDVWHDGGNFYSPMNMTPGMTTEKSLAGNYGHELHNVLNGTDKNFIVD